MTVLQLAWLAFFSINSLMASKGTRSIRATTRSMAFKTRSSSCNPSVTIYEPEDVEEELSPTATTSTAHKRQTKRIKREPDAETSPSSTPDYPPKKRQKYDASSPRKVVKPFASPKKPKPIPQALASPHPVPENWREVYDTIKEMRSRISAPVDTMGCDQAQHKESDPKVRSSPIIVIFMNLIRRRTEDLPLSCLSCSLRKPRMKSLMLPSQISEPLLVEPCQSTRLLVLTNLPLRKRLIRLASGDAKQGECLQYSLKFAF